MWNKLTDDAQVDDVWNLSYMSSTSFKWLLLTMNVTFEHIIVSIAVCLKVVNSCSDLSSRAGGALGETPIIAANLLGGEVCTRFVLLYIISQILDCQVWFYGI